LVAIQLPSAAPHPYLVAVRHAIDVFSDNVLQSLGCVTAVTAAIATLLMRATVLASSGVGMA